MPFPLQQCFESISLVCIESDRLVVCHRAAVQSKEEEIKNASVQSANEAAWNFLLSRFLYIHTECPASLKLTAVFSDAFCVL